MTTQDTDLLRPEAGERSFAGTSNLYSSGNTPQRTTDAADVLGASSSTLKEARDYAKDMGGRAKEQGRAMFDEQKDSAAGKVDSAAHAFRNTAEQLQGEGQSETGRYVGMLADRLESFGSQLRNKNLDTLIRDAENIARRSPGAFVAGSVIAGFVLSRFLKSSSERAQQPSGGSYDSAQQDDSGQSDYTGDRSSYTDGSGRTTYDVASYDSDGASLSSPTPTGASGLGAPDLNGSVMEGSDVAGVPSGPNTGAPSSATATPMATANESLSRGAFHDNR
jgi:hypothetical protein